MLWLALGISVPGLANASSATLEALARQAADLARERAHQAHPDGEISVSMVPLDPRLRLEPCDELEMSIPGDRVAGRVSIRARCRTPVSWGVYLTAQVDVVVPVVTVARPVPRGSVLRPADLAVAPQNLAGLRPGHLSSLEDALGMAARTGLRADAVLYQHQLAAPKLVSRGDTVVLSTRRGVVTVTTQAVALADGVYGEAIEVRNPRSERTVTAWVTGRGTVAVRP